MGVHRAVPRIDQDVELQRTDPHEDDVAAAGARTVHEPGAVHPSMHRVAIAGAQPIGRRFGNGHAGGPHAQPGQPDTIHTLDAPAIEPERHAGQA